jgi:hypothetical protein
MHLINDKYFIAAFLRLKTYLFVERSYMLNTIIGGGIQLDDI